MGRHAGWLTAAASLAKGKDCEGVDAIYLPEEEFDIDEFLKRINKLRKTKSSIVIAVSEGIKTKDGKFVCELSSGDRKVDAFGHKQLSGTASTLASIVAEKTGLKTRAIEFSTLQRAASHIASLVDVNEAELLGMTAVDAANNGKTGVMAIIDNEGNTSTYDIHDIANVEKKVPLEWINSSKKQMKKEYLDYAKPLIKGQVKIKYKNGLPVHLVRK
jgi:6-phosphofructokinase 1